MDKDFNDSCEVNIVHEDSVENVREMLPDDRVVMLLAEIFKTLGDPTRIKILYILSIKELCVCDIAETLGMKQSAISHQLRTLRNLRLVKYRREGKEVYYSLDDNHILNLFREGLEHVKHTI